ncbi:hypothetical protein FJY90_07575, partial [Candidatus Gottesmanbacteria bacterium]|nr:hypothetical protein [Candidatus Gottesmanbacteria bacterium]
ATLPPQCNWCTNYNYCVNVARCTWRNPQPSPAPCSVAGDGCCDCPGAAGKIIKIPPALMDVNKDGIIDSKDLLYCIRSQVKKGKGLVCDINQDGVVNALDYSLIRFNYTETAIR